MGSTTPIPNTRMLREMVRKGGENYVGSNNKATTNNSVISNSSKNLISYIGY